MTARTPGHGGGPVDRVRLAHDTMTHDVDATIMWLSSSLSAQAVRRDVAHRIMCRSVFTQAAHLGLVRCPGCGDQGCVECPR